MTSFFRVRNLEKFQHYKDRNPPWIKLYNDLLENYEFGCLQDASKLHLIFIWLLASRSGNHLPHDSEWIKKRINATTNVDLNCLINSGFLEKVCNDSEVLADRFQDACPETEREAEREDNDSRRKRINLENLSIEHISSWLMKKRSEGRYVNHDENFIIEYFKNYCRSKRKKYDNYISALQNAFEWESCQPKQYSYRNYTAIRKDPAATAASEAERIIAKRRAERNSTTPFFEGTRSTNSSAIPDLRQPKNLL